jgi:hypothetical protein
MEGRMEKNGKMEKWKNGRMINDARKQDWSIRKHLWPS